MSDKQEYQRNPTFYSGEGTPAPQVYAAGGAAYAPGIYQQQQQQQQQQFQPQQQYAPYPGPYVQQQHPVVAVHMAPPVYHDYHHHHHDEHLGCARLGCLLSWIPLIGLITFVLNVGAPMGSRRRRLAWISLFVAAFMVCSSLGLVFVLYFTAFAAANANH
ncbi:uncharacterized protein ACA1_234460 [Acanthamoeba castellanii str. Neff]|uniref:Uncharacterized protein n=1 Tax=Acanthamoeba castellanii (strain ATCC 30010 / Neff) TaxID=1257118 RepID=L8H2N4_ACACF|nr:uncharacterized protein ACA1_234460 [Acanthamoeba castellanii str. Neff]ELR18998.1 hypothetical protein ACA1_234460 [Acanthamoeba castellanii str. Neff]